MFLGNSNPWDPLPKSFQQQPRQIFTVVAIKEPVLSAKITDPISCFNQKKTNLVSQE